MIDAKELRLGNFIDYKLKEGVIEAPVFAIFDENEIEAFPIPLTDEWLLKFGFEKHSGSSTWDFGKISIEYDNHAGFGVNYANTFLRGIEYVHELQNLVYAITGEELIIKQTEPV